MGQDTNRQSRWRARQPARSEADRIPGHFGVWSEEQFFREYFVQTRKEIDIEKHERDQLLNFSVLFVGAVLYGLFRGDKAAAILSEPIAMTLEFPALVIVSALFWVRHMKLQQITDRLPLTARAGVPVSQEEVMIPLLRNRRPPQAART